MEIIFQEMKFDFYHGLNFLVGDISHVIIDTSVAGETFFETYFTRGDEKGEESSGIAEWLKRGAWAPRRDSLQRNYVRRLWAFLTLFNGEAHTLTFSQSFETF